MTWSKVTQLQQLLTNRELHALADGTYSGAAALPSFSSQSIETLKAPGNFPKLLALVLVKSC
ncbi:MAG: hypothetical protein CMF07_03465 [Idiomarina sp.]|nr:hypothetical protein [Idiomarina sp.]